MANPLKKSIVGRLDRHVNDLVDRRVGRIVADLQSELAPVVAPAAPSDGAPAPAPGLDQETVDTLHYLFGREGFVSRTMSTRARRRLIREIRAVTENERVDPFVRQAYWSLLELEARGAGRIAGSTSNILGKLVTTPLLAPPAGPILEIGSLYGLFAAGLVRQFGVIGESRSLTIVDPLEGHQIQTSQTSTSKDITATPVLRGVLESNLAAALSGADVRVVQGYSTDDAVRATAGDSKYAVVVVDGDHSDDGVFADLKWVEDIVLPGAVVVIDDFGGKRWPGVQAGTERYLAGEGAMRMLGTVSTSAFLRFDG